MVNYKHCRSQGETHIFNVIIPDENGDRFYFIPNSLKRSLILIICSSPSWLSVTIEPY